MSGPSIHTVTHIQICELSSRARVIKCLALGHSSRCWGKGNHYSFITLVYPTSFFYCFFFFCKPKPSHDTDFTGVPFASLYNFNIDERLRGMHSTEMNAKSSRNPFDHCTTLKQECRFRCACVQRGVSLCFVVKGIIKTAGFKHEYVNDNKGVSSYCSLNFCHWI